MPDSSIAVELHTFAPALERALTAVTEPATRMGTESEFRRFRSLESSLVSVLDHESSAPDRATFYVISAVGSEDAALASFVLETNPRRPPESDVYGRVDLVITSDAFRSLGLAKVIVLAGIQQMMLRLGGRLYSISCLAAHVAIEKILLDLGFEGDRREERGFRHLSIRLDDERSQDMPMKIEERLNAALRVAKYRIRQRKDRT